MKVVMNLSVGHVLLIDGDVVRTRTPLTVTIEGESVDVEKIKTLIRRRMARFNQRITDEYMRWRET